MNPPKKLTSQQKFEQEQQSQLDTTLRAEPREFASVEEMLRHDSLHTPVPPHLEQRLAKTLEKESPPAPVPWWKRLFRG